MQINRKVRTPAWRGGLGEGGLGGRSRKTRRGEEGGKSGSRDRTVRKRGEGGETDRQQLRVFFRVVVTINPISPRNYVDERWLTERVSTSNFLVLSRSTLAVNPPHTTLTSFP